ncbi:MAG: radical SAM protein [Dehalococcoidales bacterium]|nr:radical SAM protein [Dehalococcoidales bacterium]
MNQTMLSFMPVTACNMNCPNCTQTPWRRDFPDYQMTPDEVTAICNSVREHGLHFAWAHITGGEAALWEHLAEGLRIIRESGVFDHTEIWSNCKSTKPIVAAVGAGLVDRVVTQSANSYKAGIRAHKRHGDYLVVIDPSEHRVHPSKPLDNVLPAACGCDRVMVSDYRVWPCANAYSNFRRMGMSVDEARRVSIPLDQDWPAFMDHMNRFNMQACQVCLANGKVWNQSPVGLAK